MESKEIIELKQMWTDNKPLPKMIELPRQKLCWLASMKPNEMVRVFEEDGRSFVELNIMGHCVLLTHELPVVFKADAPQAAQTDIPFTNKTNTCPICNRTLKSPAGLAKHLKSCKA